MSGRPEGHRRTGTAQHRDSGGVTDEGVASRKVALNALARVDDDGAFANIALPGLLERSGLHERDRALVTDLVYGTLRRRRACEFLIGRFLSDPPPPAGLRALLLGAYQIAFRPDIPSYAAVSATVGAAPKRYRGLVNAVLRRVSAAPVEFPDLATELSYPDWIIELLTEDHGSEVSTRILESMNEPAVSHRRSDGYVQDLASQWVADHMARLVLDSGGGAVVDLCAAPGGKATSLAAHRGLWVVALDQRPSRVALLQSNIDRLGARDVMAVTADARRPPLRPAHASGVLLDAPCSGLGVLRRRADARWRLEESAPRRLAALQATLVDSAVPLVRPGGVLLYSVCTLTALESIAIDEHIRTRHPQLRPLDPPGEPWIPWGRGALLLPQAAGTDGMAMFAYRMAG